MSPTRRKSKLVAKQKKSPEDIYYPVPEDFNPIRTDRPPTNQGVIRQIIRGTIKSAYRLKDPPQWDYHENYIKPKAVATSDQVEMVMHLIESLQPADAIEAALASQFAITYIRGMEAAEEYSVPIDLFEFGHKVLEALQKYRSKGAQQISVQYNVNQGQVVNIKTVKSEDQPVTLDGVSA
ncbi:MAG: hypothetical protein WCF19_00370 [Chlamydiales bacterium]